MALPIVFNNQTYAIDFLSQDNNGVQSGVFENDGNNPQPYTLNGTVNSVGDPVVFTPSNGGNQFTIYATNLDNPNQIVFSENEDGTGFAIIASNTQLVEGETETFSETTLGDYTVVCYCPGTLILTERGEVPIEQLTIGDRVVTLHGGLEPIRWIGRRSYDGRFVNDNPMALPVCIKAGALGQNTPARDLYVSPGHALYIDGVLIHAHLLVNGVSITQVEAVDEVTYLNIELEQHDVILAEGTPAETFFDNGWRNVFENAAEYAELYLNDSRYQRVCAPQLHDGFQLEAIRARIDARAGIVCEPRATGPLQGYIDLTESGQVQGWARDLRQPNVPVMLDVLVDGQRIQRVLANLYRSDVRAAGHGSGRCGFVVSLPEEVRGHIEVRRSCDQAVLPRTSITPAGTTEPLAEAA
ncbi:Hint domain-containing protein [Methylorubrum rhodesianum]|uniref:Hint domain-containing protein n=1 Tax=Methylorubrum rhodesianum TaxID=29427 RepID=A0ABU9ZFB8_9HYPH